MLQQQVQQPLQPVQQMPQQPQSVQQQPEQLQQQSVQQKLQQRQGLRVLPQLLLALRSLQLGWLPDLPRWRLALQPSRH